jgi:hypothetical protein
MYDPVLLDLIENITYFNETNFLYVRYLLHHDHAIKNIHTISITNNWENYFYVLTGCSIS